MENEILLKISDLDFRGYSGYKYTSKDILFLISVLKEEYSDDVYIAALSVFTLAEDSFAIKLLDFYEQICKQARLLALPMLASSDSVKVYIFMLKRLRDTNDTDESSIIIACLAETHYPVLPIIIESLIDDDKLYLNKLKLCLKRMGLKKITKYLMMSPQIPFEAVFIDIFGQEKIQEIKQRK